ncbi:MAG: hypothetical protein ACRDSR_12165 [Pseudonocardiaceae bacterium]
MDPRVLGAAGVLHLQRAAGNRAVARLLGPRSPVAVQRVLLPTDTNPSVLQCPVTHLVVRHKAGGVYESLDGTKAYTYDGTKLVEGTSAPSGVAFGVATPDATDKPPPGTEVVEIDDDTDSAPPPSIVTSPAPWLSPGGTHAKSPGGTGYRQMSPSGSYRGKTRRDAGGYKNPGHSHANMLPHWENAALSPIPEDARGDSRKASRKRKRHLMDQERRFRGTSPGRSREQEFQGHSQGVLGHEPSASTHWNATGHTQPRKTNQEHNRSTGAYHGIEWKPWSDASGAHEPRYNSPGPHLGSDPSWWHRDDPRFKGGPWHSWEKDDPGSASIPPGS